ncbi:hypothetical protein [Paludibacter sp.]|uniref:hypothetical protein n=1 Tax=Paludibacter sp. TaxID=1898105 RepID=UPI001355A24A|nr:hypothetical protein [Paludibacter sp.]MTK52797.1 hypothetical protein [Paludibacter sp.]
MNRIKTQSNGKGLAKNYNIAICSIVRDCSTNLKKNIPIIEEIRSYFKSSVVIVFENDSTDDTKETLKGWRQNSSNTYIECVNYKTNTIPNFNQTGVNKYFSSDRISKMVEYRNNYLDKLQHIDFNPDFVMIVDLDVSKIYLEGIFHSFGIVEQWDVVCANGYSLSPKLTKRYHDSYALVELYKESIPQSEISIRENAYKWGFLKKGMPLMPVYSAYGGLAIYRFDAIESLTYRIIQNNNPEVEVRCEHFAFCQDIRNRGFQRIFINPDLKVKYQSVNIHLIVKYIKSYLSHKFKLNNLQ